MVKKSAALVLMTVSIVLNIYCLDYSEVITRLKSESERFGYNDIIVAYEKAALPGPGEKDFNIYEDIEVLKIVGNAYSNLKNFNMAVATYNKVLLRFDTLPGSFTDQKKEILYSMIESLDRGSELDSDYRSNRSKKLLALNRLEKMGVPPEELSKIQESKQEVLKKLNWRDVALKNLASTGNDAIEIQIKKDIDACAARILDAKDYDEFKFLIDLEPYSDSEKETVIIGIMSEISRELVQYYQSPEDERAEFLKRMMLELQKIKCALVEKRKNVPDMESLYEKTVLSYLYTESRNKSLSKKLDDEILGALSMTDNVNDLIIPGKPMPMDPQTLLSAVAKRMFERRDYQTASKLYVVLLRYYDQENPDMLPVISEDMTLIESLLLLADYYQKIKDNGANTSMRGNFLLDAQKYLNDTENANNLLKVKVASALYEIWDSISDSQKPENYDPLSEIQKYEAMIDLDKLTQPEELVSIGDSLSVSGLYDQRQVKYYQKAFDLLKNRKAGWEETKWLQLKLAHAIVNLEDRKKALEELQKTAEKKKDERFLEELYFDIGHCSNASDRLNFFIKSFNIAGKYRKPNDPRRVYLFSVISRIAYHKRIFNQTADFLDLQLESGCGTFWDLVRARRVKGYCLESLHKYPEAEKEYKINVKYCSEYYKNGSGEQQVETLLDLGNFYYRQSRIESAERNYNEAYFRFLHSDGQNYFTGWKLLDNLIKVKLRLKKFDMAEYYCSLLLKFKEEKFLSAGKIDGALIFAKLRLAQCRILQNKIEEGLEVLGLYMSEMNLLFEDTDSMMFQGVTFDPLLLKPAIDHLKQSGNGSSQSAGLIKIFERLLKNGKL